MHLCDVPTKQAVLGVLSVQLMENSCFTESVRSV